MADERESLTGWVEAIEAWAVHMLSIAEDRRIPSADLVSDGHAILAGLRAALAGSTGGQEREGEGE